MQQSIHKRPEHETRRIPLTAIRLNPILIIRRFYDEVSLEELDASMSQHGQIYPVIVRTIQGAPDTFELFAGTRRFKRAEKKGLKEIDAIIMSNVSDQRALVIALGENLQRQDLTPFEEAWVILRLTKEHGMGIGEIAQAINKGEIFVRRRLQLLSLPQEIQQLIADRTLSLAQVETLMSVTSPAEQLKLARAVMKHQLSDGEFLTLVREGIQNKEELVKQRRRTRLSSPRFVLQIKQFGMRLEDADTFLSELKSREAREIEHALKDLEDKIQKAYARIRRIRTS